MNKKLHLLLLLFALLSVARAFDDEKLVRWPHSFRVQDCAAAPEFNAIRGKIKTGDASALEDLKILPIRDAELILAGYMQDPKYTSNSATTARSLIVQIPGIWDYYSTLLKENIEQRHGIFIGDIFKTIAGINTDDSIKLIGPYLFSSVDPKPYAIKTDYGFPTVSQAAMSALHSLDLQDSPTKGQLSPGGSNDVRLWQNWWKENAHRYFEEAVPSEAATVPAPPPPIAPEILSPPQPPAPLPDTLDAILLNAGPPPPNWYPLAIAVALLLAIGFYYHFRRRNER